MRKLPGIEVVKRAYGFLASDFGTIVRIAWLPLLIVSIVQFFVNRAALEALTEAVSAGDLTLSGGDQSEWPSLISTLLAIVGGAIVTVALHRVVLFGDRKPGTYVYFNFGKVEGLFVILPLVVGMVIMLAFSAIFASTFNPGEAPNLALIFLFLLAAAVLFFLSVRLALLWPIIVVEERFDFQQAWNLSRGNFWRLFGTFILALLPFVVVMLIAGFIEQGAFFTVRTVEDFLAALRRTEDLLPYSTAVNYVITVLLSAVSVAVLGYAYKALKGYGPDDIVQA